MLHLLTVSITSSSVSAPLENPGVYVWEGGLGRQAAFDIMTCSHLFFTMLFSTLSKTQHQENI